MKNWVLLTVLTVATGAVAEKVEWDFPRLGSCHEGMAFSDGVTGVLVWGGGDTMNLTVGRADLWDHRGGYSWLKSQSYTNIVSLVQAGKKDELLSLFKKETPKGEPRNPYMLPLGRVVIRLQGGATLTHGELDPFTGLGKIVLSDGKVLELAMSKASRAFAMKVDPSIRYDVAVRHCLEFPEAKKQLESVGVKPATMRADGFDWELPADRPVSLRIATKGDELFLSTWRGDSAGGCSSENCTGNAHFTEMRPRFDDVCRESAEHWTAFWREGARVKVPDRQIQEIFDYGMYRFGAMTDPDGIPAGLQGVWLEDDQRVPWNGDYHFNINVQECYSPAYRGGHFAHLMPLFKMVLSWRPLLRENARLFAGIGDGYVLPHSVDDRGVCIGGFWTGTIDHACTAWIASMMYRYVRYSGDVAFLKDGAYDFMKGAMNVYRAMMEEKDSRLSIPLGPSPEWGAADVRKAVGRDPSFQLAAAHRLARDLVDAAGRLGEPPDAMWLDVEKRLPKATFGAEGILLFEGQPLVESHRHHSHLAGLYPFDVLDLEAMRKDGSFVTTYETWVGKGNGLWSGWCVPWASILQTHFGQATAAAARLREWETFFCNPGHGSLHNAYASGYTLLATDSAWTAGRQIMQMDGQCAAATAAMELMVHEVNGKVEFFRGCPESWKDVSFENVALADGRRVSGRRLNGKVTLSYDR